MPSSCGEVVDPAAGGEVALSEPAHALLVPEVQFVDLTDAVESLLRT